MNPNCSGLEYLKKNCRGNSNGGANGNNGNETYNNAPVSNDKTVSAIKNSGINIKLSASDPDGDDLIWHQDSDPSRGSLSGTAPDLHIFNCKSNRF